MLRRGGGQYGDAARLERCLDACRDLRILTRDKVRTVLDNRDLRTEIRIVRCELESDIAAADDDETARECVELHHGLARIATRALRRTGDGGDDGKGSCIDKDTLRMYLCLCAVLGGHTNGVRINKTGFAVEDVRARTRDFVVVLLPQHSGETALLGDGSRVSVRLFFETAALRRREACAVFERF